MDEAGRGPLAGPLVAAAVMFPEDLDIQGARDSKTLSPGRREELFGIITECALGYAYGVVEAAELDSTGMAEAVRLSFARAAGSLGMAPDLFIVDGLPVKNLGIRAEFVIKGDSKSLSVAAAGILAKVTRDRIMKEAHGLYPGYGFGTNMGYGTEEHLKALAALGPCPIHRRSFSPLRDQDQLRLPLD